MKKSANQSGQLSPENYIRKKARNLPVKDCYINKDWKDARICNIIIVRQHTNGNVTFCMYMVDLDCLGVKDSLYQFNIPYAQFEDFLKEGKREYDLSLIKTPYKLVHNIIHAGIEYAEEYGFKPCKEFTAVTGYFLDEDTDDIPLIQIECGGEDGKPLYINNGYESATREKQILAQLEQTAGAGNYHFMLSKDGEEQFDEDEIDDDSEIDEKFSKLSEELNALSKENQKKMFLRLYSKKGISNDEDTDRLYVLSTILSQDIIDQAEVEEVFTHFEETFDIDFVDIEVFPNTLFIDVDKKNEDKAVKMFSEVIHAIIHDSQPKKAIAKFRKVMGDVCVSDFLEMYYLQKKDDKEALKRTKQCFQKSPDYFMFQAYYYFELKQEGHNVSPNFFENLLLNRQSDITTFEADIFFYFYAFILLTDDNTGLSTLVAFMKFIDSFDFQNSSTFKRILTFLNIGVMKKIYDYFELNGDKNKGKTYYY